MGYGHQNQSRPYEALIFLSNPRLFEKLIDKVFIPETKGAAFDITSQKAHWLEYACVCDTTEQLELLKKYKFDFWKSIIPTGKGVRKWWPYSIPLYNAVKFDLVHILEFYFSLEVPMSVPDKDDETEPKPLIDLAKYKFKKQDNLTLLG